MKKSSIIAKKDFRTTKHYQLALAKSCKATNHRLNAIYRKCHIVRIALYIEKVTKFEKKVYDKTHKKDTTKKSFSAKKYEHILAPYKLNKVLIYESPSHFITANFLHVPIIYASIIKLANNGNTSAQNILQGYGGLCSFDDLVSTSTMSILSLGDNCKVVYHPQYGYTLDINDKPTRQAVFSFSSLLTQNRRDSLKSEYFTIVSDNGNHETTVNATDRKSIAKYCEFKEGSTNRIKLIKAFWNERNKHFTPRTLLRLEKVLPLWLGGFSNDIIGKYLGLSKSQVDNLYTILRKKYREYAKDNYKVKGVNKRITLVSSGLSSLYLTYDKKGKEHIKVIV